LSGADAAESPTILGRTSFKVAATSRQSVGLRQSSGAVHKLAHAPAASVNAKRLGLRQSFRLRGAPKHRYGATAAAAFASINTARGHSR